MADPINYKYYKYNVNGKDYVDAGAYANNPNGYSEINFDQFKPIAQNQREDAWYGAGKSYYDYLQSNNPTALAGGASQYVNNNGVQTTAAALAPDPNASNPNMQPIKDPTTGATLYVPTGSAGAAFANAGFPNTANNGSAVLKPEQVAPAASLSLQGPDHTSALTGANATVTGAVTGSDNLQGYIDKLTPGAGQTPEADKASALSNELSNLYGQDVGKAAALDSAEKTAGVPDMTKQLQDINNEIQIKNAEYEKLLVDLNGQPIPMGFITGQQAQVRLQKASEIGLLSARAQAMQGNIALAKETVAKAVDLQFSAIEEQIAAKEKQLNLIQPLLSAEQAKIANAQQLMLSDQKQAVADQKADVKTNLDVATQYNVKTEIVNQNGKFFNARTGITYPDPASFFKAMGVTSFQEAYAKGLVTDINPTPDLSHLPSSAQEFLYRSSLSPADQKLYDAYQTADANRKRSVNNTTVKTTSTIEEYNFAVSQGFKGTFLEYKDQLGGNDLTDLIKALSATK